MSSSLAQDLWLSVLYYLNETQVHSLRSAGDRWLISVIGKRTAAFYERTGSPPAVWPRDVTSESKLLELDMRFTLRTITYSEIFPEAFTRLENLPKSLTKLSLRYPLQSGRMHPFCVSVITDAPKKLAELDLHFPSLRTFNCGLPANQSLFLVLPSSLTHYFASPPAAGNFHPSLRFPPNLVHLRVLGHTCAYPENFADCAATLETLIINTDKPELLPPMPRLKVFRDSRSLWAPVSKFSSLELFPSLTALEGCPDLSLSTWVGPKLEILFCPEAPIQGPEYARLPRSLTLLEKSTPFDPAYAADLPRSVLHLAFNRTPRICPNLLDTIPPYLLTLDIRYTLMRKDADFAKVPATLTCLHTHSLKEHTILKLQHCKELRVLGLFGGRMSALFARRLPRSLTSLRLTNVSLRTKGNYSVPVTSEVRSYSVNAPDTLALRDTLPMLKELIVTTHKQSYWWENAYDIFHRLPLSLEKLFLAFNERRPNHEMAFYPPYHPYDRVPTEDRKSDVFSRLVNLKELSIFGSPRYEDKHIFSSFLPPHLESYYVSSLCKEDVQFLPKTIRRIASQLLRALHNEIEQHLDRPVLNFYPTPEQPRVPTIFNYDPFTG